MLLKIITRTTLNSLAYSIFWPKWHCFWITSELKINSARRSYNYRVTKHLFSIGFSLMIIYFSFPKPQKLKLFTEAIIRPPLIKYQLSYDGSLSVPVNSTFFFTSHPSNGSWGYFNHYSCIVMVFLRNLKYLYVTQLLNATVPRVRQSRLCYWGYLSVLLS